MKSFSFAYMEHWRKCCDNVDNGDNIDTGDNGKRHITDGSPLSTINWSPMATMEHPIAFVTHGDPHWRPKMDAIVIMNGDSLI